MKACTIFSHATDLQLVYDKMVALHGQKAVSLEGSPDAWTTLQVTTRKLLRKSTVTFNVLRHEGEDNPLADMTYKMQHVFRSIQTEATEVQQKLLVKIGTIRLGLGVVADRRIDAWEEAIFGVSQALDGIVFWGGNQMLNAKGHIILDFEGKSRVSDLEVKVDADYVMGTPAHSEEADTRKTQNEVILAEHEVPVNLNLPPLADSENTRTRTKEEVADRALALCLVALKGEGLEAPILAQVENQYGIADLLSPAERSFMQDPEPEQQARVNFAWRYESLWVMLWALGYADVLAYPDRICDVQAAVGLVRDAGSRAGFHAGANLRSTTEVLDQADLVYRLHWATVDARLRNFPPPADMEAGVVFERHYALNWLRGYGNSDWDDVQTDT